MNTEFEARMKLAKNVGTLLGTISSVLLYDNENLNDWQYRKLAEAYLDEKLETVKDQSSQWAIQSFMPTVLEIIQEMDNREIYVKDEYRKAFINYSPVLI
jgi:hypothetical protein